MVVAPSAALVAAVGGAVSARVVSVRAARVAAGLARFVSVLPVGAALLPEVVFVAFPAPARTVLVAFAVFSPGVVIARFPAGAVLPAVFTGAPVADAVVAGARFAGAVSAGAAFAAVRLRAPVDAAAPVDRPVAAAAGLPAPDFPPDAAGAPAVFLAVLFFGGTAGALGFAVARPLAGPRFGELTAPVAPGPAGFTAAPARARFPGLAAVVAAVPARADTLRPVPAWSPVVTFLAMSAPLDHGAPHVQKTGTRRAPCTPEVRKNTDRERIRQQGAPW